MQTIKQSRTWIVVADGKTARILLNTQRAAGISELDVKFSFKHDLHHEHKLQDEQGRHDIPHHHDEPDFFKRITRYLEAARQHHEFEHLVIVAPATAMGDLRKDMGKPLHDMVLAEIVHDYTHQSNDFIYNHIKDRLPL